MTQFGPGRPGQGKSIRQILKDIEESDEQLLANPLFKEGYTEGYEAGYQAATENHRQLTAALAATYRIDRFGE
jgi:flagellar biosynthesis/type III secretory pathway protein FliH